MNQIAVLSNNWSFKQSIFSITSSQTNQQKKRRHKWPILEMKEGSSQKILQTLKDNNGMLYSMSINHINCTKYTNSMKHTNYQSSTRKKYLNN